MLKTLLLLTLDTLTQSCYNKQVFNKGPMEIQHEDLVALRHLQEDIASDFCDETMVSGECYWECVETLASIKLMEMRGEVVLAPED